MARPWPWSRAGQGANRPDLRRPDPTNPDAARGRRFGNLRYWLTPGMGVKRHIAGMAAGVFVLLVGALAHYVVGLDWVPALLLGAVLAPTDPVFAAALVGLSVNVGVTLAILRHVDGVPAVLAKVGGIGVAFFVNFVLNQWVVFRASR